MDFVHQIPDLNYWAILSSALSAFVIGWVWYGPLFGKTWMKLNGFTEEDLKEGKMSMPVMLLLNYIATALAAFAIAIFIGAEGNAGFMAKFTEALDNDFNTPQAIAEIYNAANEIKTGINKGRDNENMAKLGIVYSELKNMLKVLKLLPDLPAIDKRNN